mmetsp:Transcript_81784/g.237126  ORF Transcript_81784/g.237126 Transcript_81784/m.237126 type:complete len:303 (+) Transcript_81784:37-945(+)
MRDGSVLVEQELKVLQGEHVQKGLAPRMELVRRPPGTINQRPLVVKPCGHTPKHVHDLPAQLLGPLLRKVAVLDQLVDQSLAEHARAAADGAEGNDRVKGVHILRRTPSELVGGDDHGAWCGQGRHLSLFERSAINQQVERPVAESYLCLQIRGLDAKNGRPVLQAHLPRQIPQPRVAHIRGVHQCLASQQRHTRRQHNVVPCPRDREKRHHLLHPAMHAHHRLHGHGVCEGASGMRPSGHAAGEETDLVCPHAIGLCLAPFGRVGADATIRDDQLHLREIGLQHLRLRDRVRDDTDRTLDL